MEMFLEFVTAVLFAVATASLFAKDEGKRGLGRVVFGGAVFLTGVVFGSFTNAGLFLSLVIMICGVATGALGFRKYARRNLPSAN
jgi:hypothetical protein